MATLTPVEGNPFETQASGPKLTPVEGDPFKSAESAPEVEQGSEAEVEDLSVFQELDRAFLQIPGAPAIAEFAAAANRSIFDMVDFLGPGTVNAVLELAGSEKRVPTASGTLASPGGYMEEGVARDAVQGAGEVAPAAIAVGSLLRTMAGRLPAAAPGESALRGTARQLGQSTPAQDAIGGIGAGAGGEIGEAVGGDTGRLAGSVAGSMVTALPAAYRSVGFKNSPTGLNESAAPTVDQLKGRASELYKAIDDTGAVISQDAMASLSDDIAQSIKREGFNARIHPKLVGVLEEVAAAGEKPMSISEIDTLRRVAQSAARSIEPDEARLGRIAIEKIDDFLDRVPESAIQAGDASRIAPMLQEARGLWSQARKTELIQQAVEKAKNQASGFENGLRTQFRSLLNNPKKMRGFTEAEKDAIRMVVRGDTAENIAKAIGKFGFTEGQATSMLLGSLGIAGGAAVGGPLGGVVVPAIGQLAKNQAAKLTERNARLAEMLTRSGSNGKKVVLSYYQNVPAKERSVEELTGLLLQQKVKLPELLKSTRSLVSNAALAASLISSASSQEEVESNNEDGLNDQVSNQADQ